MFLLHPYHIKRYPVISKHSILFHNLLNSLILICQAPPILMDCPKIWCLFLIHTGENFHLRYGNRTVQQNLSTITFGWCLSQDMVPSLIHTGAKFHQVRFNTAEIKHHNMWMVFVPRYGSYLSTLGQSSFSGKRVKVKHNSFSVPFKIWMVVFQDMFFVIHTMGPTATSIVLKYFRVAPIALPYSTHFSLFYCTVSCTQ